LTRASLAWRALLAWPHIDPGLLAGIRLGGKSPTSHLLVGQHTSKRKEVFPLASTPAELQLHIPLFKYAVLGSYMCSTISFLLFQHYVCSKAKLEQISTFVYLQHYFICVPFI